MLSGVTKRRVLLVAALLAAAVGCFLLVTVESILWPRQEVPERVDAVVVLAGGRGERVVFGLAAIELGLADTILVSESSVSEALCAGTETSPGVEVLCIDALDGTDVEISQLSELARENGIESVLLVTSNYHLQRAERWMSRCFDGEVFPLAADASPTKSILRHELLATVAQVAYQRSCPDPPD